MDKIGQPTSWCVTSSVNIWLTILFFPNLSLFLHSRMICTAIRTANPLVCNGNENLCSLRFNQVTFPGTHNAGSGFCGPLRSLSGALNIPCFTRNQDLSFTEQLQLGIRFFDIDLCYLEQVSDGFSPAGRYCGYNCFVTKKKRPL